MQKALDLLYLDSEVSENNLSAIFEKLVKKEIDTYQEKMKLSKQLKEFSEQENGDRIYILPAYERLTKTGHEFDIQTVINSVLAHEILHVDQERRGLNIKYPSIKEGVAWVLQLLYGIDHIDLVEYMTNFQKSSQIINPNENQSNREQQYATNVTIGLDVVMQNLNIDLRGNINEQLKKFMNVFDIPLSEKMESEVIYRFFKPRIQNNLK